MGYSRIQGELIKVGYTISRSSVKNILKRGHFPPSPRRKQQCTNWRTFLGHYADQMLACDFFTVETMRLQTIYAPKQQARRSLAVLREWLPNSRNPWTLLASPCLTPAHVPCYLPANSVTRGQSANIVALSAGFTEPVSGQLFEDIPPGSTFYDYIERLANRGLVSGYPCGGQGEPCGPSNLPYFRAANLVTRGQLSKMTSEAFGYDDPASAQSFQDVPVGSTFHPYIERLAARGILNGYPCGGPGEDCVPPGNLPYFRPNNPVTRGQTAKILYLARSLVVATPTSTITAVATATSTATPALTATATPSATSTSASTATPLATDTPPVPTATTLDTSTTGSTSAPSFLVEVDRPSIGAPANVQLGTTEARRGPAAAPADLQNVPMCAWSPPA